MTDRRSCGAFEQAWQQRLDGHAWSARDEAAVRLHLASCAACRALDLGYRRLAAALFDFPPAVVTPSSDCFERVLNACEAEHANQTAPSIAALTPFLGRHLAWRWSAAAAAAVLLGLGVWAYQRQTTDMRSIPPAPASRPLSASLWDATSATLSLARSTSTPVARAGRYLLTSASEIQVTPPLPESSPPPRRLIRAIGSRVLSGVRPISESAQHAFGFLVDPEPVAVDGDTPGRRGA